MTTTLRAPEHVRSLYEAEVARTVAHNQLVREALAASPRREPLLARLVKQLFTRSRSVKQPCCTCQCA